VFFFSRAARIREHARAKSLELLRSAATDTPEPNDTHRHRLQPAQACSRRLPAPRANLSIEMHDSARKRQQHADGVIGHFFEAVIGNVRHPHAAPSGFVHSDIVETDAEPRDDLQVRARADRLRAHHRPVREDADRLVLHDQGLDLGRGRGVCGPGDEPEARAFDDLALDLGVRPRVIGDQHRARPKGCAHSIRL